jgi:hypothetical protein
LNTAGRFLRWRKKRLKKFSSRFNMLPRLRRDAPAGHASGLGGVLSAAFLKSAVERFRRYIALDLSICHGRS